MTVSGAIGRQTALANGRVRVLGATSLSQGVLLLFAFSLPFEASRRPLPGLSRLTVTNLSALYILLGVIALYRFASVTHRTFPLDRVALGLLTVLVAWSLVSALTSTHPEDGIKWVIDLCIGGAIWHALPLWLRSDSIARRRLLISLVCSGTLAAAIGLLELAAGPRIDAGPLSIFKVQPTVVGPYLRLSGTFAYANTAAGYFAAMLPLAVALCLLKGPVQGRYRLIAGSAALTLGVALIGTYSRGGAIAAVGGLAVLAVASRHAHPWRVIPARWSAVVLATIALVLASAVLLLGQAGALRISTQSDLEWYSATYAAHVPHRIHTGTTLHVPVTLRNTGAITWVASGHHAFRLSYHWMLPDGHIVVLNGRRTPLPRSLRPGSAQTLTARVTAPSRPGQYRFAWDIAQEGVLWFALATGVERSTEIHVVGPAVGPALRAIPSLRLQSGAPQPERTVLWAAALRIIEAHPLLGIGPDGYRRVYGLFEHPPAHSWDTRIYANSLPLELAADLGIPGAIAFFLFLIAATRTYWRRALHGDLDVLDAALFAALITLVLHGTVDYLFGARAMMYLLWILLGVMRMRLPAARRLEPVASC
jgi:hypothetical protein